MSVIVISLTLSVTPSFSLFVHIFEHINEFTYFTTF